MRQMPEYSLKLASERRIDDRLSVAIDGEALEIGSARRPVAIRDLSLQGAMFEADPAWTVGVRIWLFFPSGPTLNAKIVWVSGARHGCQFLRRLSEDELLLARSG